MKSRYGRFSPRACHPANRFASAEEAEVGPAGLAMLHKQLTLAGKDTEYGRELEGYLSRIVNPLGPM